MDLLESAGAAKAEVLINAIDDPQTNLQLTEMVKEHFPHCRFHARDVDHYIRLRQAGVEKPERETFEGALKTGRLALESLGLGRMKRENVPMCSAALIFRWWKRWQWLRTTPKPARRSINAPARC
ncbi:NAD-binding protein [Escherichia coli]